MAGKKGGKAAGAPKMPAKKPRTILPPSESQTNLTLLLQAASFELPGLFLADLQEDPEEATLEELLDEARDLPQQPSALWVVATRQLTGVPLPHPDTGKLVDPWLMIVLDARTGEMLFAEPHPLPSSEQIAEALLLCMLEPNDGSAPLRPAQILTEDGPLALSLHMILTGLGVKVERQDLPGLNEALAQMVGELESHLGEEMSGPQAKAPVFLAGVPADETEALVAAFRRFLAAEPWEVFSGTKPVYVAWNATPDREAGQFYATLMGRAGQEFGLTLYPDWLNYALHIYNFSPYDLQQSLEATGGTEALVLSVSDRLHPDDLAAMYVAGADLQSLPGLLRIGPDGPLTPLTPVALLPLVLDILAERAESRSSAVTSLTSERGGVRIRYPAGPRDELSVAERAGSVRVVMEYAPNMVGRPAGEVVLSGPADMLFRKAMGGLRAWLDERDIQTSPPFRLNLSASESGAGSEPEDYLEPPLVWESRVELPDLTLAHLARMSKFQDAWFCDLTAEWQPGKLDALSIVSDFQPGKKATKK